MKEKILKYMVLGTLSLIAMILCGTAVMKILDILLQLDYENVWAIGFKVGFVAWVGLAIIAVIKKMKMQKQK